MGLWVGQFDPPAHLDGFIYRPSPLRASRIDVFEDLLCEDTQAFDPVMKEFLNTEKVGNRSITDYLEVVVHLLPLPYHHNAFFMTQLVPYVHEISGYNTSEVFRYMEFILSDQDEYLAAKSRKLNEDDVKYKVWGAASAYNFFTFGGCMSAFNNKNYEKAAKSMFK